MIVIDKLCYTSTLRYTSAKVKTALAVITLILCVIDRSIALSAVILFSMGYLTVKKGGIPLSRFLRLLRIPVVFLLLSTIAIIINLSPQPLSSFAIPLGSSYLTVSPVSLLFALQLIMTALASVSCLFFLSLSTPVTDILTVFKQLHCPDLLIELMLLIYRFIFVLLDIADALSTAQHSRLSNIRFKTSLKASGNLISALFVRAFKKSSFLYDAMESRCYDGRIRVLNENYRAKKQEIFFVVFFELFLLVLSTVLKISGYHI